MTEKHAPKNNLMPIGRFSNACRLSIKALRHYDERGLLKPSFVDPDTGYRYYRSDQARDAVMIALLRSLEIPLETIKHVLRAEGDELRRYLDIERDRIERGLAKKRHALHSIERIARHGDLIPYDVALRSEPDYQVASIRCTTTAERMVEDSGALMYTLFDELARLGVEHCDPYLCTNEAPDPKGNIIVHACVGVGGSEIKGSRVAMIAINGGPVAWLTHIGAYEELGIAYHALSAWAQERGHEQRGALREVYRNDPANTPIDELITEVILPIHP